MTTELVKIKEAYFKTIHDEVESAGKLSEHLLASLDKLDYPLFFLSKNGSYEESYHKLGMRIGHLVEHLAMLHVMLDDLNNQLAQDMVETPGFTDK